MHGTSSSKDSPTAPADAPGEVDDALARLFPPAGSRAWTGLAAPQPPAHPAEQAGLGRTGGTRRREFLAGRACAHRALRALGRDDAPLPPAPSGEPVWPPGTVGSIAHGGDLAAAVVASTRHAWTVGLDIEPLDPPLEPGVEQLVLTAGERSGAAQPHPLAAHRSKIAFCVKECVYKGLFPATGWRLEFADVTVDVDLAGGGYCAAVDPRFDLGGGGLPPLRGSFAVAGGHLLVGLWLAAAGGVSA